MSRLPVQILAFTLTRFVLNTMQRMVYPFLAILGRGLGVDLPALSLAVTARSVAGAFGPFLASVADSRGRKFGMLAGLLLFSLGAALVVSWPVFPAFVLALILSVLGKYAFDPSMQAYLGDRVPYRQRALVMGVTEFGWSLSFILGVPLVGFLIARGGWIAPFPLFALLSLVSAAGLFWLLPKDPEPRGVPIRMATNFRVIFSYSPALAGLAIGILISAANEMVNLVFGVWMEDSFGVKIAALGVSAAVIGFSELGGESLVTILTDRMGKEQAIGAGTALNCLAALALPWLSRSFTGALAGLFLFYLTFEFTLVSAIPLMSEILPSARATLMALTVAGHSAGRALGDLLAPSIYTSGIQASGWAAAGFDLLGLLALGLLVKWTRDRKAAAVTPE